jgi:hypothetical protein
MRMTHEQIDVIAFRVIRDLSKLGLIRVENAAEAEGRMSGIVVEELTVEDRLNDEVRDIMRTYDDQIRRADVEFHEMFKVIKSKLARERNIIL